MINSHHSWLIKRHSKVQLKRIAVWLFRSVMGTSSCLPSQWWAEEETTIQDKAKRKLLVVLKRSLEKAWWAKHNLIQTFVTNMGSDLLPEEGPLLQLANFQVVERTTRVLQVRASRHQESEKACNIHSHREPYSIESNLFRRSQIREGMPITLDFNWLSTTKVNRKGTQFRMIGPSKDPKQFWKNQLLKSHRLCESHKTDLRHKLRRDKIELLVRAHIIAMTRSANNWRKKVVLNHDLIHLVHLKLDHQSLHARDLEWEIQALLLRPKLLPKGNLRIASIG